MPHDVIADEAEICLHVGIRLFKGNICCQTPVEHMWAWNRGSFSGQGIPNLRWRAIQLYYRYGLVYRRDGRTYWKPEKDIYQVLRYLANKFRGQDEYWEEFHFREARN
jgi:hypothetical protein